MSSFKTGYKCSDSFHERKQPLPNRLPKTGTQSNARNITRCIMFNLSRLGVFMLLVFG